MRHSGRYGAWLALQQQLPGHARDGKSVSGLSVFLNVTQANRATSVTDNQVAAGLFYNGLTPALPTSVLGIGVARTNVNGHAVRGGARGPNSARHDAEYAAELYFGLQPAG